MESYTSIFIFIGGIFWTIASGVTIYLFTMVSSLKERVQRVEDLQGSKLDNLKKDFEDFRHEMKDELKNIAAQIHKEKNQEQQMNTVLTLILKQLEAKDEKNI
jgi:regulator of sirC expression with transglutaminase-like and TPR domain